MKAKYSLMAFCLVVFIISLLVIEKKTILNMFMVEADDFTESDLMVVLEGGAVKFSPTRERVNKAIELYYKRPNKLLVCAYRVHKNGIIDYLLKNGINSEHLAETTFSYEGRKGGGTYNNVLEILSLIKDNTDIHNIEIITSPYHELRVSIIFDSLIQEANIDKPVHIKYSHVIESEVNYTDTPRFIRIIFHEILGILGFYASYLYD